jgi:hypothetical protein
MFKHWNLTRILTFLGGAAMVAVGFVVPVLAPYAAPVGAGLVGLAIKAPGTVTQADVIAHGEAVAAQVVPAVIDAAISGVGRSPAQIGVLVTTAARAALNALPTPK